MAILRQWLTAATLQLLLMAVLFTASRAKTMEELDDMVKNDPELLCTLTECLEPQTSSDCPDGTRWQQGVTMGGCCGGCVQFLQEGASVCTGKVDPQPCTNGLGAGYGSCDGRRSLKSGVRAQNGATYFRDADIQADQLLTSNWCDYGMYCNNKKCIVEEEWTSCINTQAAYDRDRELNYYVSYRDEYRWRPQCEQDGSYSPVQSKGSQQDTPRMRVCVDPEGNSIAGKAFDFQGELYDDMNCLCSRRMYDLQQAGRSTVTLHCLDNGNYEPLQCQDGWCYCVHPDNGTIWGYQLPEAALYLLPCFNSTLVGELYLRQCDSRSNAHHVFVEVMESKGVKVVPVAPVTCSYDGSYGMTQCTGSTCSCVNRYGKSCLVFGSSGCDCMRDKLVYDEYDQGYSQLMCEVNNGHYMPFQEMEARSAGYLVDKLGLRLSPVVRTKCESGLHQVELNMCQKLGNLPGDKTSYCNKTCTMTDGTDCTQEVYLYGENYVMSDTC